MWRSTTVILGALLLASACSSGDADADRAAPPLTAARAQAALIAGGSPADGDYRGGTFDFGRRFEGGSSVEEGRLASSSWDVYFVSDDGGVGAWGSGLDVFASDADALAAAEQLAGFFACAGPRQPVPDIVADEVDLVEASSCAKPGDDGFIATLSAADGNLTTNLTVSADTRRGAATALADVWPSLRAALGEVEESLGS